MDLNLNQSNLKLKSILDKKLGLNLKISRMDDLKKELRKLAKSEIEKLFPSEEEINKNFGFFHNNIFSLKVSLLKQHFLEKNTTKVISICRRYNGTYDYFEKNKMNIVNTFICTKLLKIFEVNFAGARIMPRKYYYDGIDGLKNIQLNERKGRELTNLIDYISVISSQNRRHQTYFNKLDRKDLNLIFPEILNRLGKVFSEKIFPSQPINDPQIEFKSESGFVLSIPNLSLFETLSEHFNERELYMSPWSNYSDMKEYFESGILVDQWFESEDVRLELISLWNDHIFANKKEKVIENKKRIIDLMWKELPNIIEDICFNREED